MPLNPTRRARINRVAIVSALDTVAVAVVDAVADAVIAALAHFGVLNTFTQTDRCAAHTTENGVLAAFAPAYCQDAGV